MRSLWFVLIGLLILAPVQFAQTSGSIAGVILDQSGSAIPGATVGLTNTETNAARSVLTNEAGAYSFPTLPPGTYNLKAEKSGFKSLVQNQGRNPGPAERPHRFSSWKLARLPNRLK